MVEIIEYGCCTDYIAGKERPLFDVRLFDLGEKRYAEEVKQALTYLRNTLTDLVVNTEGAITLTAYHTWRRKTGTPLRVRITDSTGNGWLDRLLSGITEGTINQFEVKLAGDPVPNIYFVRF